MQHKHVTHCEDLYMKPSQLLGHMDITFKSEPASVLSRCGIKRGALKLPDGVAVSGGLIAVGENESFLHCFAVDSGSYCGILKSDDENDLYQHILRLNKHCE